MSNEIGLDQEIYKEIKSLDGLEKKSSFNFLTRPVIHLVCYSP